MWEMAETMLRADSDGAYMTAYSNRQPSTEQTNSSASPVELLRDGWEPCGVAAAPGSAILYIFKRKWKGD